MTRYRALTLALRRAHGDSGDFYEAVTLCLNRDGLPEPAPLARTVAYFSKLIMNSPLRCAPLSNGNFFCVEKSTGI